jgi:sugar lactone lactonase YvrE
MDQTGRIEVLAEGLHFPTSLTFDDEGNAYVTESGLPFAGAPPGGRVWRLHDGGERTLLADGLQPPVNGLVWHDGALIVSEANRITRLTADGGRTTILDRLPGPGNYHTNMVVIGPDGWLYFSQGAMTNLGIVGLDAYEVGWLRRLPHSYDLPGYDVILAGVNAETANPLERDPGARAVTGASQRICIEHAIAEPKQWRPLQHYLGRRDHFPQTALAIAGLVSDRAITR